MGLLISVAAAEEVDVPAGESTSEPTFVFLRPETSSFWHTATNATITVPVDFPSGATSATLEVSGPGYSATYPDITTASWTFSFPAAVSPASENVYDLTLAFDDGTVRTAKLGLVESYGAGSEGRTRCLAPRTTALWRRTGRRAVLPIPFGVTSFTVDGVETDTGLGGAQGWYALAGVEPGSDVPLALSVDGVPYAVSLTGAVPGFQMIFR